MTTLSKFRYLKLSPVGAIIALGLSAIPFNALAGERPQVPADVFDLSHWNITVPIDKDRDGKSDTISVKKLKKYSHPDFFYLDEQNRMVFATPNKAATTKNSSNTRSELRHMLRGKNTRIKTHGAGNNFAVRARKDSDKFGSVGGRLDATLQVDHVARRAENPDVKAAFSAVVGQIHAVKYDNTASGFGYGNEPLKIFYKKFPGHETGSVFWTYERNLPKDDPNRTDIAYPVWGNLWTNKTDPKEAGIALGEPFS
ncbi:MAG: polysaccharide lyase family 7 protein, partial [Hyphomonadaceae bacterium]|nr:polysaccharide lyase family 7 protein [Hyphomonadaceae bacterium]